MKAKTNRNKSAEQFEAYYGLPNDVSFCSKCVMSNQRPSSTVEFHHTRDSKKDTLNIGEQGVCDACRVAERKKSIDWEDRDRELRELCDKFRRDDGRYDCMVPGSGGKDSFYAAHKLKYEYGMNPLTITWAPHIYTDVGWRNMQAWIHTGFDNVLVTPNGRVHRLLTRLAVDRLFHPFQPFIIGQKNLAPSLAVKYDIPLVFYGESEAEYGDPADSWEIALRTSKFYASEDPSKIFFGGTSLRELQERYGLKRVDLDPYMPEAPELLQKHKIEVHYLGYYLKWHPQGCYYYSVENGGFEPSPERTPGTYSKYNSIDDKMDDFHYWTTWIKFGLGRASYDAAQEIRSGEITRKEGVALVKRFDGEWPDRFAQEVFRYLSIPEKEFPKAHTGFDVPIMSQESFLLLADKFRSPHLWKNEENEQKLRHVIWEDAP